MKTQNYYLGNFGIVFDFEYQYGSSMFESISDAQCSGVNCTHTAHTLLDICHSDVNMILNNTNWEEIKSNSDFVLVFIGHDLCRTKPIDEVQTHYDVGGVRSGDICLIEATASDYEFKTVIHELGHFFGAPDHYDQNGFPSTGEVNTKGDEHYIEGVEYNGYCIYGENKTSAENGGNVMCAGCTYRINQYFN